MITSLPRMKDNTQIKRIGVLGGGSWGTALANMLSTKNYLVHLWCRDNLTAEYIHKKKENPKYLPGLSLDKSLQATSDLELTVTHSDLLLFVSPSHATRELAQKCAPYIPSDIPIVSATKGIENDSLMFMDEIFKAELPAKHHTHLAFLSGPSFAKELAEKLPTAVVIASENEKTRSTVQHVFHTSYLRTYASHDVIGVECGGALKNVIAIAAGISDGLGFGHNTRAALITRGLAEIARVALARGGEPLTLAGLSGMGDLILTCTGELSRNRTVGLELGKGKNLPDILNHLGHVAEGVKTTKSARDLALKLGIELPIVEETYKVLYEEKPAHEAVRALMDRALGSEFK